MKKLCALLLTLLILCGLANTCVFAIDISPGDVVGTWYAVRAEDEEGRVYQPPEDIRIDFERDGSSVLTIDEKKQKGTWNIWKGNNGEEEIHFVFKKKHWESFKIVDEELVSEYFNTKKGIAMHSVLYFSRDSVDPLQLPQTVTAAEEKDFFGEYEKCGTLEDGRYFSLENGPDLYLNGSSVKQFIETEQVEPEPMHIRIDYAEITITGSEAQYHNQYSDKDEPVVVMTNFKDGKLTADKWVSSEPITISKLDNGGIRVDITKEKMAYFFCPVDAVPEV